MPARKRRTTDAEERARALVAPGIRAPLGYPQPVAGAPGEADSLRSRFWGRWARIPERQLRAGAGTPACPRVGVRGFSAGCRFHI